MSKSNSSYNHKIYHVHVHVLACMYEIIGDPVMSPSHCTDGSILSLTIGDSVLIKEVS